MFGIVINEQGYKVEFVVLNDDKTPQFYNLKDGETIIENNWQIANGMNKPQWTGEEWVDTDPLPPMDEIPPQPTELELLTQRINALEEENKLLKERMSYVEVQTIGKEMC